LSLNPYPQIFQNVLNEIVDRQFWIEEEGCFGVTVPIHFIKKIVNQSCLARPHLPGNDNESFLLSHPIK